MQSWNKNLVRIITEHSPIKHKYGEALHSALGYMLTSE